MFQKNHRAKAGIGLALLAIALSLVLSVPANAVGQNPLIITTDTAQINAVDTSSSATPNQPAKPSKPSKPSNSNPSTSSATGTYSISMDEALQLAKQSLNADDSWMLTYQKLVGGGSNAYYAIVLIDPIGDAHLRLVDASTGKVTVLSLWEYFTGSGATVEENKKNDKPSGGDDRDNEENESNDGEGEGDFEALRVIPSGLSLYSLFS